MEQYAIKGGNPLVGEVEIGGAKNAALGILAASIMTDETVLIENVPDVRDTNVMMQAIESIGGIVERVDRHPESLLWIWLLRMILSKKYVLPIICWGHCLESIRKRR